jgi:hypothetical protein
MEDSPAAVSDGDEQEFFETSSSSEPAFSTLTGSGRPFYRGRRTAPSARLRDNPRQPPATVPQCPPKGDCSTCKKCELAVELEW